MKFVLLRLNRRLATGVYYSQTRLVGYHTGGNFLKLEDHPDRVIFKSTVTVHGCLNGRAPPYLSDYCVPVAFADTRRHLRSTNRQLLAVPRYRLSTYGRRAFSVTGPQSRTRPSVQTVSDGCLKRTCSLDTSAFSALEVLNDNCAI